MKLLLSMGEDRLLRVADGNEPEIEEDEVDSIRKARQSATTSVTGRVRSRTISDRLSRTERRYAALDVYPSDVDRPYSRGDCSDMPKPCPFVSCSHHLYLDVNEETGAIKFNFPHLEVWEMEETCSLDVADRGGITLEEVGAIMNLTRERIRQVEVRGLVKIRMQSGEALGIVDHPPGNHED